MRYLAFVLLLFCSATLLPACGGGGCDDVVRSAFKVTVHDENGAPVCDAQIVVTHAGNQSTLRDSGACAYVYARDVTGDFTIVVLRNGYQTATESFTVDEDSDGCHAETVIRDIGIVPSQQPGGDRPGTR